MSSTAPASGDHRRVRSHRGLVCHDLILSNGLRLLVLPTCGVPTVEVRLNLPFARHRRSDAAAMELLSATVMAAGGTGSPNASPTTAGSARSWWTRRI